MQRITVDFRACNNLFAMLRILDQLLPTDDYSTVAQLNHHAFVQAHASVLSAEAMQQCSLEASIASWSKFPNPNCKYGFAYDGAMLVGFTVVTRCRLPEYNEHGEMTSLYVHVDHHHKGIGRAHRSDSDNNDSTSDLWRYRRCRSVELCSRTELNRYSSK